MVHFGSLNRSTDQNETEGCHPEEVMGKATMTKEIQQRKSGLRLTRPCLEGRKPMVSGQEDKMEGGDSPLFLDRMAA